MILRFVLMAAVPLLAQNRGPASTIHPIGGVVNSDAMHIHTMPKNCKGEADRVYGKSKNVYYACVGEKTVCSAGASRGEKIPPELIANFDASMAELAAKQQEFKARQAARAERTTTTSPLRSRPIPTRTR